MGQQQSKDELLYQQVSYGNVDGIRKLRSEGAGLEWMDREAKTPLIAACMNPELLNVSSTLIELGANLNAYRPGRHAGTPLHHAAKRGHANTVKLLLSHGANPLLMNDDCQTPLDVAREKGYINVVREIENHISLFSGWLREIHGPGFLGAIASKWVSRNVWVVVLPCGARTPRKPFKLELALYSNLQDVRPRSVVSLWKAHMEEPNFDHPDPVVIIAENTGTRTKLAPLHESEKLQLQRFCGSCKGIPQGPSPAFLQTTAMPVDSSNAHRSKYHSVATSSIPSAALACSGSNAAAHVDGPSHDPIDLARTRNNEPAMVHPIHKPGAPSPIPSAPPLAAEEAINEGPIHYPLIDEGPIELPDPGFDNPLSQVDVKKGSGDASSSCVICLDAAAEGACIPCGHMAGCMSCLKDIKAKKWGCPVCRSKIDQVIKVYTV